MSKQSVAEEWRPCPDYEGIYSVSNIGRVRRDAPGNGTRPGRILKPVRLPIRYLQVGLCVDGVSVLHYVHRLVALAFIPNPENKPFVNHINGVRDDARAENLEWSTRVENAQHAVANGLLARGEKIWTAKLTEGDIPEIRRLLSEGMTRQAVADIYGVTPSMISKIGLGQSWKHVDNP